MRTLVAGLLLASLVVTQTGCPGGCGALQGASDRVYARGADQMILCDNGGFVADVAGKTIEGYYTENPTGSAATGYGTEGDNQQLAFELYTAPDGTVSMPQLGGAPWSAVSLDPTSLDHADVRCQNLETRTWWSAAQ